jgi:hypothetical protein
VLEGVLESSQRRGYFGEILSLLQVQKEIFRIIILKSGQGFLNFRVKLVELLVCSLDHA